MPDLDELLAQLDAHEQTQQASLARLDELLVGFEDALDANVDQRERSSASRSALPDLPEPNDAIVRLADAVAGQLRRSPGELPPQVDARLSEILARVEETQRLIRNRPESEPVFRQ